MPLLAATGAAANPRHEEFDDEGPFVGGVFANPNRGIGAVPSGSGLPVENLLVDAEGYSNQLILLLDRNDPSLAFDANPAARTDLSLRAEEALMHAVNARSPQAQAALYAARGAHYALRGNRLSDEVREELDPDGVEDRLQRYITLTYDSPAAAAQAARMLHRRPGVASVYIDQRAEFSALADIKDPYFASTPETVNSPEKYQWGMQKMNFPEAWGKVVGHGYVGAVDSTWNIDVPNPQNLAQTIPHPDFSIVYDALTTPKRYPLNYAANLSFEIAPPAKPEDRFHGLHVAGIIAARVNNYNYLPNGTQAATGVAGGCPNCSVQLAGMPANFFHRHYADGIAGLIYRGVPTVNLSLGHRLVNSCGDLQYDAGDTTYRQLPEIVCDTLKFAKLRDVLVVAASGNWWERSTAQFPANQDSNQEIGAAILPVGAYALVGSTPTRWTTKLIDPVNGQKSGSAPVGTNGVMAPGVGIVSTALTGALYSYLTAYQCRDDGLDPSGVQGDAFAHCTGTSMATPHVSALAGLLRAAYPRLSADQIKAKIQASGSLAAMSSRTAEEGWGMPDANKAVDAVLALNPKRLTPLFAMYSAVREDYFYTTVPQMAAAARQGSLRPMRENVLIDANGRIVTGDGGQYAQPVGNQISGYGNYPGLPGAWADYIPKAEAWIFTTQINPLNGSLKLMPLYRMSWKCGSGCANPFHMDTTYTTDEAGIRAFADVGYRVDGIEGYIYPKDMSPQPPGSVKLMRKYNPTRDDHAIFPETRLSAMAAIGYTQNSGSDWLGYVYPNSTGAMPNY